MDGVQLKSLRVTADMDVSAYTRAMQEKVAADARGAASSTAVGEALARQDAATEKTAAKMVALSRQFVNGYGDAARFEKAIRDVGRAFDSGQFGAGEQALARVAVTIEGVYKKFGLFASAQEMAKQGFVSIAPIIEGLNSHYVEQAKAIESVRAANRGLTDDQVASARAAQALANAQAAAAKAQADFNAALGISRPSATSQGATTDAFSAQGAAMIQAAEQAGRDANDAFSRSFGIGMRGKVASESGAVFAQELDRLDTIAQQKAAEAGRAFAQDFNASLGIGMRATDSGATYSALTQQLTQQERLERGRMDAIIQSGREQGEANKRAVETENQRAAALKRSVATQDGLNAEIAEFNALQAKGKLTQEEVNLLTIQATKRFTDYQHAMSGVAGTGRRVSNEMTNLSFQLNDVVTGLMLGQSPFMIMAQQGGQVLQILQTGQGGVSGTLKNIGSTLMGLVTPTRLAMGGLAAGALTVVYANYKWTDSQYELNRALSATGLSAGVTRNQINQMAESVGKISGASTAAARATLATLANRGNIDPGILGSAAGLSRQLQANLSIEAVEANQLLAQSLTRPAEGYKRLTDVLGGYNVLVDEHIKRLVAQGRLYEAQQVLLDQIPGRLSKVSDVTNNWARAWHAVTAGISNFITRIGQLTDGPLGQFMDKATQVLNRMSEAGRATTQERNASAAGSEAGATIAGALSQTVIYQRALANVRKEIEGYEETLRRLREQPNAFGTDAQSVARYNREVANTNRLITEAKAVEQGLIEQRQRSRTATPSGARPMNINGREALEGFSSIIEQNTTNLTEEAARAQARLREELQRRVDVTNNAIAAGRTLGEADTARLASLTDTIDKLKAIRAGIDAMGRASQREREQPGFQDRLADLIKQEREATERIRSATQNRGEGLFDPAGRFVANQQQVIMALRTETDLIKERGEAQRQSTRASSENLESRIRAAERELRIEQDRRGTGTAEQREAERQQLRNNMLAQEGQHLRVARNERERGMMLSIEAQQAENRTVGQSLENQERVRIEQQLINDARREYIRLQNDPNAQVPAEEIARLRQLAAEMAKVRNEAALLRLRSDIKFDRDTIGLSDTEIRIAQQMKSIYGDGWRMQMQSAEAQQMRFNDQLKLTNDLAKGFASDLLSGLREGKSLFEALTAAATKFNNRLADMALERFMGALMNGQNPFAIFSGTGGQASGSFGNGGLLSMSPSKFFGGIESAVSGGTEAGFVDMWGRGNVSAAQAGVGGFGSMGGMVGGGLMAGASVLGAYGAGQQGGPLAGAISGAMGGAMGGTMLGMQIGAIGGPLGAALGAVIGTIAGVLGGIGRGNPARDQAATQWRINKPETDLYISQLKGEVAGSMATSFAQETKKVLALSNEASMAREGQATWKAMEDALWKFKIDTALRFVEPLDNMLVALESGLGSNSPIAQAHQTVRTLREEMLKFISDTKTVRDTVGVDAVEKAQKAAQAYALSLLTGAEQQTAVRQEFDRINQTALSLGSVLVDLGMSSEAAAAAIAENLTKAIDDLKTKTSDDLTRRLQSATGLGYLNEITDAIKQWEKDLSDATLLGMDKALVDSTNLAEIQKIITGAKLTDDAFADLIEKFPELEGVVRKASSTLEDILDRQRGYLDRVFAAGNDTSTLEGQLLAFERQAVRQREEEIKAGGEAMAELELAIAAERLKVIRDFQTQQTRVLEQAQEAYLSFVRRIKEYTDGLRAGAQSPLSPQARLSAAQSQYDAQLALAAGGNRDALNGITSYANDLLEAAKAYYASSTAFQTIWGNTINQLEALPGQVSAEQFIVNAINAASTANVSALDAMKITLTASINSGSASATAAALASYFTMIDSTMDEAISFGEMLSALGSNFNSGTLQSIFAELDGNGNGLLEKAELIKGYTQTTGSNTGTTAANTNATTNAVGTNNILTDQIATLTNSIVGLQGTATQQLQILNANFSPQQANATYGPFTIGGASNQYVQMTGGALDYLRKITFNTWAISNNTFGLKTFGTNVIGTYGSGGRIDGPSHADGGVMINAEGGEFMLRKSAASALSPFLDDLNSGRLPVMPMPMAGNDNRSMAVVRELRELRKEVTQLRAQVAQHAAIDAKGHDRTASAAEDTSRKVAQNSTDMRQAANRPRTAGRY